MVSKKVQTYLHQLIHSGDAQAVTIGEFLNDQMREGEDQQFLVVCAEELRDTAQAFIDTFGTTRRDFQIRTEELEDGEETVECFTTKAEAERRYNHQLKKESSRQGIAREIIFELIEVLQQDRIQTFE